MASLIHIALGAIDEGWILHALFFVALTRAVISLMDISRPSSSSDVATVSRRHVRRYRAIHPVVGARGR